TPLTSIAAAIDAIAAQHPDASAVPTARVEIARLKRFLDTLVDMVRIDSGQLDLKIEAIDLTDAIASAVHDLKAILRGHH
ncbi:hypothetical protein ABTH91_21680, partial [Acinetobacter baumannii]